MRILFLGTPDFAVPSLQAVLDEGHAVVCAVTQPDKPRGRGGQLARSPVKVAAERAGIPVFQPRRVRHPDAVAHLRSLQPDLTVTAAFGQILSAEVLAVPRLGSVNVHASLLPRWRGAAPIQRALLAGDAETGITTMWMDEGLDTGDIILQRACPIAPDETGGSLHDKLAALGAHVLRETLRLIDRGTAPRVSQDDALATYAKKLERADERIDWGRPAADIGRQVRALHPWPVAYTTWERGILKVWQAAVLPEDSAAGRLAAWQAPGTVLGEAKGRGPVIATGEGALVLEVVQPEGKGRMSGAALLAGYRLEPGSRLGVE